MIHRVTIALADWLRDPDTGPNHYLPNLVLEPEDDGLQLEPVQRVYDPFRDAEALVNEGYGSFPCWVVTPASPIDVQGEVNQDEQDGGGLETLIRLLANEIRSPKTLRAQAYYMHALNLAVSGFFAETEAARAARQRGPVQIISCLNRAYALAYEPLGEAFVTGEMLIRSSTRNTEGSL